MSNIGYRPIDDKMQHDSKRSQIIVMDADPKLFPEEVKNKATYNHASKVKPVFFPERAALNTHATY